MFKLFRHSSVILRLCEVKHFTNNTFNKTSTVASDFNLTLTSTNLCRKYCSKEQQNESTESNIRLEDSDSNGKDTIIVDPEMDKKLKVIALEVEVMRQEGYNIPSESFMKKQYWDELLKLQTRTARRRYLTYLFKLEKTKENAILKKEKKRLKREMEYEKPAKAEDGHIIYNLANNNIFLRIYESTMNNFYNSKLVEAIMFGQQLVVDCGYDKNMTKRENHNCAKQMTYLFADNRTHIDPYDIHFCNLMPDSELTRAFYKHIPTMYEPWFPLNIHKESYHDIFPKEKLIYLTPDCRTEMLEYDHDAVYIIGAIVDKTKHEPLSLAKAKKEGLKMMKLPLDRYLNWGIGSGKSLTLNQVISILLDVKRTGDWKYALRHVPRRKVLKEDFQPHAGKNIRQQEYNRNTNMKRPQDFNKTFSRNPVKSRLHVKSIMYE